jgi:hypothetical protein
MARSGYELKTFGPGEDHETVDLCEITHRAGNRSAMMSANIPFLEGEEF